MTLMSAIVPESSVASVMTEQRLLGRALANGAECVGIVRQCRPEFFIDSFNARLFLAMRELSDGGHHVTRLSVKAKTADDRGWRDVPSDYLDQLVEWGRSTTNFTALIAEMSDPKYRLPACAPKSFTLKSIGDLPDRVSAPYLVKGLMAPGELSVFYGPPGAAKTFAALWMGYRASLELPVFGRRTRGVTVVYVTLEGEIGFERRLCAIKERLGPSDRFFWIAQPADLFSGNGDVDALIDAVLSVEAGLLVFDNIARGMGAGSENDGRDMGIVIGAIDAIRRETGAHFCAIHHTGKDDSKGMRGHSSLLAAADCTVEVKRGDDGARTLRVAKAKDGLDGEEHGFLLDVVELGIDDDGEQITSCIVRETGTLTKSKPTEALTKGERGWFKDLIGLFAEPDMAELVAPSSLMTRVLCLTREQVREGLRRKGRFAMNSDGTMTGAARQKMSVVLNALKDKGKIGMTDKYVWLLHERQ